jgi:hypothetical protein
LDDVRGVVRIIWTTTHVHLASDARVYIRVGQETFFARNVEETAVSDTRLCGRLVSAAPRGPRVEMGIEVDDGDRPVDFVQRAENREHDGMVTAQAGGRTVGSWHEGDEQSTYETILGCSLLSLANGRVEPILRSRPV